MVDRLFVSDLQKQRLLAVAQEIVSLCDSEANDLWDEQQLKVVKAEFEGIVEMLNKNIVVFPHGKRPHSQRTLHSTYIITDSMKALSKTKLGDRILFYQNSINIIL